MRGRMGGIGGRREGREGGWRKWARGRKGLDARAEGGEEKGAGMKGRIARGNGRWAGRNGHTFPMSFAEECDMMAIDATGRGEENAGIPPRPMEISNPRFLS